MRGSLYNEGLCFSLKPQGKIDVDLKVKLFLCFWSMDVWIDRHATETNSDRWIIHYAAQP